MTLEKGVDSHHREFADAISLLKHQGPIEVFSAVKFAQKGFQGLATAG